MYKKTLLLAIGFACQISVSFAQNNNNNNTDLRNQQLNAGSSLANSGEWIYQLNQIETEGSPLLHENWQKGSIKNNSGVLFQNIDLIYNAYKDELIYKNEKGSAFIANKGTIAEFSFADQRQLFKLVKLKRDNGKELNSFCQVLYEGTKLLLVQQHTKNFYPAQRQQSAYNSNSNKDTYQDKKILFLVKDGIATEIPKRKKPILKLLADKEAKLKEFADKNNVDFEKEKDIVMLLAYYETL